jgi:hypothetical protein
MPVSVMAVSQRVNIVMIEKLLSLGHKGRQPASHTPTHTGAFGGAGKNKA